MGKMMGKKFFLISLGPGATAFGLSGGNKAA